MKLSGLFRPKPGEVEGGGEITPEESGYQLPSIPGVRDPEGEVEIALAQREIPGTLKHLIWDTLAWGRFVVLWNDEDSEKYVLNPKTREMDPVKKPVFVLFHQPKDLPEGFSVEVVIQVDEVNAKDNEKASNETREELRVGVYVTNEKKKRIQGKVIETIEGRDTGGDDSFMHRMIELREFQTTTYNLLKDPELRQELFRQFTAGWHEWWVLGERAGDVELNRQLNYMNNLVEIEALHEKAERLIRKIATELEPETKKGDDETRLRKSRVNH